MLSNRYISDGKSLIELNDTQTSAKEQYLKKVQSGEYFFVPVPCCVCSGSDFEPLSNKDRYGIESRIVICRNCGLIQQNPRISWESYTDFYNQEYRLLYGGEPPGERLFQLEYSKGEKIFGWLSKNAGLSRPLSELSILEVGCAVGGILQYFKDQGCQVRGFDLDEESIKFGKEKHELDLTVGTIRSVNYRPDVVIYADTFEHLLYPEEDLAHVREILSTCGILYIGTPGVRRLLEENRDFLRLLQNAHTYYFSLCTLTNLVETSRFKLVAGDESIISAFRHSIHQKSVVSDYDPTMRYLAKWEHLRELFTLLPSGRPQDVVMELLIRLLKFTRLYNCTLWLKTHTRKIKVKE